MTPDACVRCGCEMNLDKGQKPLCPDCLKVPNAGTNVPYLGTTNDANDEDDGYLEPPLPPRTCHACEGTGIRCAECDGTGKAGIREGL